MPSPYIDLRSDTATLPTDEMREAMYRAEVGDSMRGEDPTMNRLEALAAEKLGKEAALFVSSGTMGNLVALLTHGKHGDEVIFEAESHAYYFEVGGYAALGGLSARPVRSHYGAMSPDDIEAAIRPSSLFFPPPRLLMLENTHNRNGGNAITLDEMRQMTAVARAHGLAIHLDGARIFNAATALGVSVSEIAATVDTVQFCLSKGLSAPVGSILVGSKEFIGRAAKKKKMVGGDLRQAGVLAAAGIIALEKMSLRLGEDHQNAAVLRDALSHMPGLTVDRPPHPTNMVFIDTTGLALTAVEAADRLKEYGVLASTYGTSRMRVVTHRHIGPQEIETAAAAFEALTAAVQSAN